MISWQPKNQVHWSSKSPLGSALPFRRGLSFVVTSSVGTHRPGETIKERPAAGPRPGDRSFEGRCWQERRQWQRKLSKHSRAGPGAQAIQEGENATENRWPSMCRPSTKGPSGTQPQKLSNGMFAVVSNTRCHCHQQLQPPWIVNQWALRELRKEIGLPSNSHQPAATPYGEPWGASGCENRTQAPDG